MGGCYEGRANGGAHARPGRGRARLRRRGRVLRRVERAAGTLTLLHGGAAGGSRILRPRGPLRGDGVGWPGARVQRSAPDRIPDRGHGRGVDRDPVGARRTFLVHRNVPFHLRDDPRSGARALARRAVACRNAGLVGARGHGPCPRRDVAVPPGSASTTATGTA